jgi:hypothetical protein
LKKLTAILIIVLLFFDSCGYIFVYIELSNHFKQEASSKINDFIPDKDLEILSFHLSDITKNNSVIQITEENEIKINGKLYDIYKKVYKKDSVYYYCLNDNNENILEQAFSSYIENKTQENSKNIPIHNILHNIIKVAIAPNLFDNNYYQSSIKFTINLVYLLPQYFFDIPTPPPKSYS